MANGKRCLAERPHAWAAISREIPQNLAAGINRWIEKYLSSGMIRGVGPVYAKRLIGTFGDRVFEIIENEPGRLREVGGTAPYSGSKVF
jgi:hypothetical protein